MPVFCAMVMACTSSKKPTITKVEDPVYIIKNVNIIPMTPRGRVMPNATLIIRNGRIELPEGAIPGSAKVIDGSGKWLMPGLIDMHVHIPTDISPGQHFPTQPASIFFNTQDVMTPYIANGVTTVFELNARPEHFGQRNEIANGNAIGPRMALAALINGGNGPGRTVNNASDGRQAVRSAKAEGYEFIKVYSSLNEETFKAIIDEAHEQGLKTIGHIPDAFRGKLKEAFAPHFGMVAHAEEFSKHTKEFSEKDAVYFAKLAKANGTWLCPTLTTMKWILSQARSLDELKSSPTLKYVHPLLQSKWLTANNYNKNSSAERVAYFQKMVDFHIKLVDACKEVGVPMVAGTDAGLSGVVGGFSLHDEIELMTQAGLTPTEALSAATRLPAIWLGIDKEAGTVEAGKRADLILLDANPLMDIKNIRKIAGVFIDGKWIDQSTISKMLSELARKNTATKNDFDWNKTIKKN